MVMVIVKMQGLAQVGADHHFVIVSFWVHAFMNFSHVLYTSVVCAHLAESWLKPSAFPTVCMWKNLSLNMKGEGEGKSV